MPGDPRDYKLELASLAPEGVPAKPRATVRAENRDYLRVLFACCGAYRRVYLPVGRERFEARCPKCLRPITFRLAPGGSDERTFVVE